MTKDDELIRRGDALDAVDECGEAWWNACDTILALPAAATPPEVLALVDLLKEARQDLEEYITHEWPKDEHPVYERKWERDMELCRRIDAALAAWEARDGIGKAFDDGAEEQRAKLRWSDVEGDDAP